MWKRNVNKEKKRGNKERLWLLKRKVKRKKVERANSRLLSEFVFLGLKKGLSYIRLEKGLMELKWKRN